MTGKNETPGTFSCVTLIPVNVAILAWWTGIACHIAGYKMPVVIAALITIAALIVYIVMFIVVRMFGRKTKSASVNSEGHEVTTSTDIIPERRGYMTVIGNEASLSGVISDTGDVEIYGRFTGDIILTEGDVRVMHCGYVEGNIRAVNISIDGEVRGRCEGQQIAVLKNGCLLGDCCTGDLSIQRGGRFVGTSEAWEMTSEQSADCNSEDNDILSS